MVKNIQLLDTSQRLFDLNVELFQSKYPEIFSKFTHENEDAFYELQESLDDGDNILNYSFKKDMVSIEMDHSEKIIISNFDIHSWYQSNFMDEINIWSDELYVYFSIDLSMGQAGSLGIWSIEDKDWVFNRRDENFCVDAVVYDKELDSFIGFYYWQIPMIDNSGEGFFLIDQNREYKELSTEKIYSDEERIDESVKKLNSYLKPNTDLKQETLLHDVFIVDTKQKLIVFYDRINKKIKSSFKFSIPNN